MSNDDEFKMTYDCILTTMCTACLTYGISEIPIKSTYTPQATMSANRCFVYYQTKHQCTRCQFVLFSFLSSILQRLMCAGTLSLICLSLFSLSLTQLGLYTVNPRFKPRGLIDFMVHNHPGLKLREG